VLRARLQDLTRQEHKARHRCTLSPDKHAKQLGQYTSSVYKLLRKDGSQSSRCYFNVAW